MKFAICLFVYILTLFLICTLYVPNMYFSNFQEKKKVLKPGHDALLSLVWLFAIIWRRNPEDPTDTLFLATWVFPCE